MMFQARAFCAMALVSLLAYAGCAEGDSASDVESQDVGEAPTLRPADGSCCYGKCVDGVHTTYPLGIQPPGQCKAAVKHFCAQHGWDFEKAWRDHC